MTQAQQNSFTTDFDYLPIVRRDMLNNAVKLVQKILIEFHGNDEIVYDGYFGPKTEAAVKEFQREQGLQPDGIVDNRVWQSLTDSISAKSIE